MSNIYIQEPPTNGKVLLKTSVGELEIELWSKEAPKTCKNFIQLCLDRFYDQTLFHRLVKGFIIQCGENNDKANCIEPIKNEFHSRLRFSRRGLVAMANNEGSDNNMEFFFTLDATPELQNTHTIFGKISGETVYNMLKLAESEVDSNERPLYPHKIHKVKILNNPFPELEPRKEYRKGKNEDSKTDVKKVKREGVKNFKLISFGDEAEQDEQEIVKLPKENEKPKPEKLRSSTPPLVKSSTPPRTSSTPPSKTKSLTVDEDSDSDYESTVEKQRLAELEKRRKEIQDEIKDIKKQYQKGKKEKTREEEDVVQDVKEPQSDTLQDYLKEKEKYKKNKLTTKGASREAFTMKFLSEFKNKRHSALESNDDEKKAPTEISHDDDDDDVNWLSHKLDFAESRDAILAKDASKKEDDWYDIYDPRNPLNKRKRSEKASKSGESSKRMK